MRVPIATEDVGDNDIDCIKCEGCNKGMPNGKLRISSGTYLLACHASDQIRFIIWDLKFCLINFDKLRISG